MTYKTEPITVPEGTPSFIVKLEKMVYRLRGFDLHPYPTDFNLNDLKPKKVTKDLGPDSLVVVESLADLPYEGGVETFAMLFGNEFQFPEKELLEKTEGSILFGFTIDKNGDYKDVGCVIDTISNSCPELRGSFQKCQNGCPDNKRGEPMEQTFAVMIYYGMNDHWKKKIKEIKGRWK